MSRWRRWRIWLAALLVAVTIVSLSLLQSPANIPAQTLAIASGLVQGVSEGSITVYKGIPFAAPPVAQLRWLAPVPVSPWQSTLKAEHFKPACMQTASPIPLLGSNEVSEDCLYLNLWTPAKSPGDKLPVMVWLHGGGGIFGSASSRLYWGDRLAKKGVVVVNLSYRLGAFSELAHPQLTEEAEYKASANYALLDQIAGLQWVKHNIAVFGGDPDNVTLFGQSAGAWYASKLMVSPLARGLFHRVIAQSGGDLSPAGRRDGMPSLADAERAGVEFARNLECETIAQLRQVPAEKILATRMPSIGDTDEFTTVVDGYVTPQAPYESFAAGKQIDVPLLIGHTANEGVSLLEKPLGAADYIAATRERYGEFSNRFLAEYPAATEEEARRSQVRLMAETLNWHTVTWARLHSRTAKSKVFFYHFTHVPSWPPFTEIGAAHGAELSYVFGFPPNLTRLTTQAPWKAYRDILVVRDVQTYWVNFARTGDPNGEGIKTWPPLTAEEEKILEIAHQPTVRDLPNKAEHALMDAYMKRALLRSLDYQ